MQQNTSCSDIANRYTIRRFILHYHDATAHQPIRPQQYTAALLASTVATNHGPRQHFKSPRTMESSDTRLDRLLTYTTFHIGVYLTVSGALIAAAQSHNDKHHWTWTVSLVLFLVSGAAGGIIAGNVTELATWQDLVHPGFRLKVLTRRTLPYHTMAYIEHLCFWFGVLLIVLRHIYLTLGS